MSTPDTGSGARMTATEALMWSVERDPVLRSSFTNVTILEHGPDVARLRGRIERSLADIPRLQQRVHVPFGPLPTPEWVDDPDFDLDYHLRHMALPLPGSERQLLDLAALMAQDAFDLARPLWQFTVVEGLEGGRAALLAKLHHTVTDGVGGLRMSMSFIDLEPGPDGAAGPEDTAVTGGGTTRGAAPGAGNRGAERSPGDGEGGEADGGPGRLVAELARQLGRVPHAIGDAAELLAHPLDVGRDVATQAVETARSFARQAVITDGSRSPLWAGRRSVGRHFEAMRFELEPLKRAAKALGGTVNDAYVTGVTGGAGAYHRAKGVSPPELRMSMPISTRSDRSAAGNSFVPARVLVPTDVEDPLERFAVVHERLTAVKQERALGLANAFAGVLTGLPAPLLARVARQQVETVDFAASNLRGSPADLFVAGARVVANHPMGPTAGTAFNATVLSYRDSLDMGLVVDTAAVDDPELLRRCIALGLADMAGQAG
ncbi:MAG TPA: wax ester/triacylglycerol synthase domain-containing protein [Acidimicrobiales bacterium]|nr:wax ester/triacylglycerol synthase domain-containing protein [Acidimicrobiales bacterium]